MQDKEIKLIGIQSLSELWGECEPLVSFSTTPYPSLQVPKGQYGAGRSHAGQGCHPLWGISWTLPPSGSLGTFARTASPSHWRWPWCLEERRHSEGKETVWGYSEGCILQPLILCLRRKGWICPLRERQLGEEEDCGVGRYLLQRSKHLFLSISSWFV